MLRIELGRVDSKSTGLMGPFHILDLPNMSDIVGYQSLPSMTESASALL
jgi:hypothetical protein